MSDRRSLRRGFRPSAAWLAFSVAIAVFGPCAGVSRCEEKPGPREILQKHLQQLDKNGDGSLTEEEYVGTGADAVRRRRDFRVFNVNGDRLLIFDEFSAIPGPVPSHARGAIPDPLDALLDISVAAMDQSYSNWDKNPAVTYNAQTFSINFLASLSPDGSRRFDDAVRKLADADGNGQVKRAEAVRFLRIQLGIDSPEDLSIRDPNGRVLDYTRFEWLDDNKDRSVTLQEFREKDKRLDGAEVFARGDTDGDGRLTIEEYASRTWVAHNDPVLDFLKTDKNFDGELDAEELAAAASETRKRHLPYLFPQFDDDGNGKLSVAEYRFTMLGNRFCWWEAEQIDADRNKRLSFEEFKYNTPAARLLCRLYFHRFDRDGDGQLSPDEYLFTTKPADEFHLVPLDGTGFAKLYSHDEYVSCGSPAVSPDGERIAFDARKGGETTANQTIMIVDKQGGNHHTLVTGMMPVWSADGTQLCCSRNAPDSGVYIMKADGSNARKFSTGWGAQWSPDGKSISFTDNGGVWVYDVETEMKREVLSKEKNPFDYIYYNAAWSPDGTRLAFKGTKPGAPMEIASISMVGDDPDVRTHFKSNDQFDNDLCWSADGASLFFAWQPAKEVKRKIHQLAIDSDRLPQLVPGQDPDKSYSNVTLTPDGKGLIATAHP